MGAGAMGGGHGGFGGGQPPQGTKGEFAAGGNGQAPQGSSGTDATSSATVQQ